MDLNEIVREFLLESYENLDQLDQAFVELEKNPRDEENLAGIFRTIHTIKGTAGFVGFTRLEVLTHAGEHLLSRLRDGALLLDAEITGSLLQLVDATRSMLAAIESSGVESEKEYPHLIAELTRLADAAKTPEADGASSSFVPALQPRDPTGAALAPLAGAIASSASPEPASDSGQEAAAGQAGRERPSADDHFAGTDQRSGEDRRQGITESSLRVDVGLLDKLMNLVGELVLARNQILQFTSKHTDTNLADASQRLNMVASELQEGVMKVRMQPIGNIWSKFPRVVRDIATQCGKDVRIEMEGRETDLDKTLIEAIKDPLTHLVRNAVDHGIELPAVRLARGKPAEGVIRLRAFHEGGQITIEIADDGTGIDPDRIRAAAVRRGLISADQGSRMSDHETVRLIFQAGFSTAETVSNISGRGVGMDVVKTNIEKIGGQIDIHSVVGEGTTLKIKIPLTLAIIPALIVGGRERDRYAIPQVSLLELVRLEGELVRTGIERIQDASFYRLRGHLLPLVWLDRELGIASAAIDTDVVNIVVLKADEQKFGLVVAAIHDTEEIVVKPLSKLLKTVTVFAGATIMGDGTVALILDVLALAQRAKVIADVQGKRTSGAAVERLEASMAGAQALLLFRVGAQRMAMPLSMVARLEEFAGTDIERSGDQDVVQYRGSIMPLVSLSDYFGAAGATVTDSGAEAHVRQVVVFSEHGHNVGLVVDQILDIVNEEPTARSRSRRAGVLGAAVIHQHVTELLDVRTVLSGISEPFTDLAGAA